MSSGLIVDRLRPGIRAQEVEAMSYSPLDLQLGRVVTGVTPGSRDFERRELGKSHPGLRIAGPRRWRSVNRRSDDHVRALGSKVCCRKQPPAANRLLNSEVPHL